MSQQEIQNEIFVDQYTLGLVGPEQEWAGTVADGGTIKTYTPPACWGPMITPKFRGGHEVTQPVRVAGAEVGDAVALKINDVDVTSMATSTGTMDTRGDAFGGDPFVDRHCPGCGTEWPETVLEGTGEDAVRCAECGEEASAFGFEYGFTVVFDDEHTIGVTVGADGTKDLAENAAAAIDLPDNSQQHSILVYEPSEMPGTLGRLRPFIGNVGTTPPIEMPDSHNAGDFGQSLIGAGHEWGLDDEEDLEQRTDGHMDISEVRPGATLICPVKVDGAGIYVGDLHANQGDGELALHTTDVSGHTELEVEVIKGLELDGPILLPNEEDLPHISKPHTETERKRGEELASEHSVGELDELGPIQVIGTGETINDATDTAFDRAGDLLGMSTGEIRARCTFTGGVSVGRLPGVVQLDILAPMDRLADCGIDHIVRDQYNL